ncbi:MAG: hypothetical protein J6O60_03995 [Lachnospiraceae bacterium]|nr:hypothetical protein [Lachnospiraceae bacterium]
MIKLKKDADIAKFLIAIKDCKGDVFYESSEGDILNLASTLSQYVFCSITGQTDLLENGTIRCAESSDYDTLAEYLYEE